MAGSASAIVMCVYMCVCVQTHDTASTLPFIIAMRRQANQQQGYRDELRTPLRMVYTLRPRQNGRRFADDTFKRIFLNENVRISIKISLKFVPKGPINNNPALV